MTQEDQYVLTLFFSHSTLALFSSHSDLDPQHNYNTQEDLVWNKLFLPFPRFLRMLFPIARNVF